MRRTHLEKFLKFLSSLVFVMFFVCLIACGDDSSDNPVKNKDEDSEECLSGCGALTESQSSEYTEIRSSSSSKSEGDFSSSSTESSNSDTDATEIRSSSSSKSEGDFSSSSTESSNSDTDATENSSSSANEVETDYCKGKVFDADKQLCDSRDGQLYNTIVIGSQIWMKENLNVDVFNSFCYENKESKCEIYGRMYTWATAVGKKEEECGVGETCVFENEVQGICPDGWHLPSKDEFETLFNSVGGRSTAKAKLKSSVSWLDHDGKSGNGTDDYGFAALPAGTAYFDDQWVFDSEGHAALFWSSTEYTDSKAYYMYLDNDSSDPYAWMRNSNPKDRLRSVRCLKICNDCEQTPVLETCGNESYDPSEKFCIGEQTYVLCNGKRYDVDNELCTDGKVIGTCGGKNYDASEKFCSDNFLFDLCGGKSYDLSTEFCSNDGVYKLCNGNTYDASKKFCAEGNLFDLCGGKRYDLTTEFCAEGLIYKLCNGITYDVTSQFCVAGRTYDLCDGETYNISTTFCYENKSYDLCGGSSYDPSKKFCSEGVSYDLCDGKSFDVATQVCVTGVVKELCGTLPYDKTDEFCVKGRIYELCNGKDFDVEKEACEDGAIVNALRCCSKSGDCLTDAEQYNVNTQFCDTRDYNIYNKVKIGSQTWMAENLRYSGGECADTLDCNKYGRLYWGVNDRICPNGWHVPSINDWGVLRDFVGKDKVYKLKSLTGWNNSSNGTDEYGFFAYPTRYYTCSMVRINPATNDTSWNCRYTQEGNAARYWCASENCSAGIYSDNTLSAGNSINRLRATFLVRCLKD